MRSEQATDSAAHIRLLLALPEVASCRAENEIDLPGSAGTAATAVQSGVARASSGLLLAKAEDAQVVEPPDELPQAFVPCQKGLGI